MLVTPHDPLGAASLLPWKTEIFIAETDHHQLNKKLSSFNGGKNGDECPGLHGGNADYRGGDGKGGGRELRATSPLHTAATVGAEPSGGGTLARSNDHGSSSSKAKGSWRSEASTRFMHMWKQFLDHEDAPLDSQYGTVRDIYGKLVGRVGGIGP